MNWIKWAFWLLLGFILGMLIRGGVFPSQRSSITESDTVIVETVRDSIVYEDTVIYETDTVWFPKYTEKAAPINKGEDSVKIYTDTLTLDVGLDISYTANITGRLNAINFRYYDTRPTEYNIIEREKTITNTVYPGGLYLNGGLTTNKTFNFGATYLKNKWQYQYSVSPREGNWVHELKLGYKIL